MDRVQKQELVTELNRTFTEAAAVVLTHYSGLTVAELSDLRVKMRQAGAGFRVTKNRLARLALEGTKYEKLADMFTGPVAIAFSQDVIAPAKVCVEYAKRNEKLIVVGGAMGDTLLDAEGVQGLATLPSLDELRGKIVGLLQAPAGKLVGVVQAPAAQLARVLDAYAKSEAA